MGFDKRALNESGSNRTFESMLQSRTVFVDGPARKAGERWEGLSWDRAEPQIQIDNSGGNIFFSGGSPNSRSTARRPLRRYFSP